MKYWRYQIINRANIGTEENPFWQESFIDKMIPATKENEEIAKREAYNGEYIIEDNGIEEIPTQADKFEAQLTYTAMMTGTLLEEV